MKRPFDGPVLAEPNDRATLGVPDERQKSQVCLIPARPLFRRDRHFGEGHLRQKHALTLATGVSEVKHGGPQHKRVRWCL